jgi:hypothetical protein
MAKPAHSPAADSGPRPTRVLPTLAVQRELLDLPRGMGRFKEYIARMTEGSGDVVVPIGDLNPMSREHVAAKLDAWIASGVEAQAAAWTAEAVAELGHDPRLVVSFVVPDDLHGGWTDRDRVDFRFRFEDKGRVARRFATVMLWVSEDAGPSRFEVAKRRLRASLYRTAYQRVHGLPADLPAMLRQEGLTLKFSGWPWHTDAARQERARALLAKAPPTAADFGHTFTLLFGDEAGQRLGYGAVGCPKYAAWDVAVLDAGDPVEALSRASGSAAKA